MTEVDLQAIRARADNAICSCDDIYSLLRQIEHLNDALLVLYMEQCIDWTQETPVPTVLSFEDWIAEKGAARRALSPSIQETK